ncbi:hypothetical protein EST38_g14496 [Candolleomyces aberdarensis]|uniref:Uncharacterized protein n=1 Tax=Candolleomyces aberdarensis TaxID=2316362 RepID=A0A4Q2CY51_9AGAR|nr:hypothetical protein EST38_g14496 [Candolleomyces aberdarensis]
MSPTTATTIAAFLKASREDILVERALERYDIIWEDIIYLNDRIQARFTELTTCSSDIYTLHAYLKQHEFKAQERRLAQVLETVKIREPNATSRKAVQT